MKMKHGKQWLYKIKLSRFDEVLFDGFCTREEFEKIKRLLKIWDGDKDERDKE